MRPKAVWHSRYRGSTFLGTFWYRGGWLGSGLFGAGRRFDTFGFLVGGGGLGVFLITVFHDVLHDERDTTVGWVERGVRLAQTLVGKSADLRHLAGPDSVGLHNASGRVGAIGG